MVTVDKEPQNIDVDELARGKVEEIEKLLESKENFNLESLNSWLCVLKQIITAADLHRTNDNPTDKDKGPEEKNESGESIYADYGDDNERIHAVDLTEQFATNSVKWTIRVRAFKIVHRLIQLLSHASLSTPAGRPNQAISRSATLKHIPDLVRLSFVAATSPYDELKVQGFVMFRFLIDKFASFEESEYPGHSILEQYKTQVFSAIKPAFNVDAPPYITAVASQVCSLWICKGLEKDKGDLKRAYQLMLLSIDKLENQSVNQNSKLYTESELEQERVEILGAWAQLYIAATEHELDASIRIFNCLGKSEATNLHSLVQDRMACLTDKWWEALKDYALLIMPAPRLIGSAHDNEQVYTREVALKLFAPIWPKLILASTIWLCRSESNNNSPTRRTNESNCIDHSSEEPPKITSKLKYFKFISGIIMKNLCTCQKVDEKTRPLLPDETVYSIRSLYLILSKNQISSVPIDDVTIAQEFYTLLYAIQVGHCRDPNRAVIRTTLDLIFRATLAKVLKDKRNLHYGLARLVASLMSTMKEIEIACSEKNKTLDTYKMHMSIRLNNLISLIKAAPEEALQEIPLREAILVVFQEMLQFKPEPVVGLALIEQLQEFYQLLSPDNKSYFVSNIFRVQKERVVRMLSESNIDDLSKTNTVLETYLNSMRSATSLLVPMKSTLINSYVKALLDCSSTKPGLLEMCTRHINLLRKLHPDKFEGNLEPDCSDKLRSIIESQQKEEETKNKASLEKTKKQTLTKTTKPQTAKITLRADFSNFYKK